MKQYSSKLSVTFSLLGMIVNFCSSLFSICCIWHHWSYHAFTTSQHFVFVRLALFSSGCTLPQWNCFCQWLQTVLQFGVPQRSIFGPVTFILYTQQLVAVVSHHSFFHHRFSDDSQLHAAAHLSELHKIFFFPSQACISDVQSQMHHKQLQLHTRWTWFSLLQNILWKPKLCCLPSSCMVVKYRCLLLPRTLVSLMIKVSFQ